MNIAINNQIGISIDSYHVRRLQSEILKLYDVFRVFCRRHGLRFYGLYGTILGAVRHNGFIPWDDDMDVAMPRRDYDRFLELVEAELPDDMKLVSYDRTPGYTNMFGKITLANPDLVRSVETELCCRLPEGIYLDVFPLDGLPKSCLSRGWHLFRRAVLKAGQYSISSTHKGNNCLKRFIRGILYWVCKVFYRDAHSVRDYMDKQVSILRENDFYSAPFVSELGWITKEYRCLFKRRGIEAEIWGEPKWVDFEGTVVPIPAQSECYLRTTYGDYMSLPPESMRRPSHCKKG